MAAGAGFHTTALPSARAGAILPQGIATGLFQGVTTAMTPSGTRRNAESGPQAPEAVGRRRGGVAEESRRAPDFRLALGHGLADVLRDLAGERQGIPFQKRRQVREAA